MSRSNSAFQIASLVSLALLTSLSCSAQQQASAETHGQQLFEDPSAFGASSNRYSCRTCHATEPGTGAPGANASQGGPATRKPGANLAGATRRPTFWNGQENDLLRAINACLHYFMSASAPLTDRDARARALYAYLDSLEASVSDMESVPFTLIRDIQDVPRGDAGAGETLYLQSCSVCHGLPRTGLGRLTEDAPRLPEQTVAEHPGYSARLLRLVFLEKTRHGGFFGYGGSMPPFSKETLSDAELGAILEYLGVHGE